MDEWYGIRDETYVGVEHVVQDIRYRHSYTVIHTHSPKAGRSHITKHSIISTIHTIALKYVER